MSVSNTLSFGVIMFPFLLRQRTAEVRNVSKSPSLFQFKSKHLIRWLYMNEVGRIQSLFKQ